MESVSQQPVMCEVCGTYFETRRGLSSHARLHLRQLGVTLSESSGAPIELLYQIIQERDGSLPDFTATSPAPPLTPSKKTAQQEPRTPPAPQDRGSSSKAGVKVMTPSLKTASQGSPSSLKESATSLVPSSSSTLRAPESRIIEGGSSSSLGLHQPAAKPLWAPQETDAPLTLASNTSDEVHVCQLCGSWYETRKGLSSHARSHLRQLGIADNETKGSPIELLYKIMADEDLKPIESELQEPIDLDSQPKSSTQFPSHLSPPMSKESLSSSLLQSPPSKRAKLSEVFSCVLCGEEFENRKGLASHSRSHLRQIGVVDLLGNSSAIEAVEELVSSGVLDSIEPHQTNTTTSSAVTSSPAPPSAQVAHPPTSPSASPSPSPALAKSQSPFPAPHLSPSPIKQTPPTTVNRAPKAKKGFRLAVDPLLRKPKPEPIETEMSVLPQPCSNTINSPTQGMPSPAINSESLNAVSSTHTESIPAVLCEFCGQLFDTRKALSCHVRAHLRYLGLTWSVNTSPIDLLKEFMLHGHKMKKESVLSGSAASGKAMLTSQGSKRPLDSLLAEDLATKAYATPLDFSLKEKSPTSRSGTSHPDTSCELCGFDFDNRKALASHCRAHLRQLGVTEWKGDGMSGSPIELLSEIIRKEPTKVAEISRRYRKGDLYIKKSQRPAPSPSISTDSDYVPGSSLKPVGVHLEHRVGREEFGVSGGSSRAAHERSQMERSHTQTQAVRGDLSVRSPRGLHPPKHSVPRREDNQDTNSQQPSRSGNIPALLPKPPLTPLVKLVGKVYSLKCRFCEEVFHGPLSIQEDWITHLQKHILALGYKGKASPSPAPVATSAFVGPVAV